MTALVIILGVIYLAALGFWIMKKVDCFLASGNIHPQWDAIEEKKIKERKQRRLHCSLKES
ncbi:MAG: hypothetical protein Q4D16_03560 [Eubacteriales bacterium]|nr:hypothetical protein [Eubacteriales bacterium]